MPSTETFANAPVPSESDTWVVEPCDDWPVYHYGDPTVRLLNAIPDECLPRSRQRPESHHEEMETEEEETPSTSRDVIDDQSSIRRLLLLPVNLMYRLWARLWTKHTEQDDDDDDDDVSAEMETLSATDEVKSPAATRSTPHSRAAQTAAIAAAAEADLRVRVNSQPPVITSSTSFPSSPLLMDDGVPFRSVRAQDIRSLAEELKLRLAAVSPSVVESHVDSETGLIHYVEEVETADAGVTGVLRRLVPRYRPNKQTGKLEIDCYITVQAAP